MEWNLLDWRRPAVVRWELYNLSSIYLKLEFSLNNFHFDNIDCQAVCDASKRRNFVRTFTFYIRIIILDLMKKKHRWTNVFLPNESTSIVSKPPMDIQLQMKFISLQARISLNFSVRISICLGLFRLFFQQAVLSEN